MVVAVEQHLPDVVLLRRFLLPNEVDCSRLDRLLFSETHKVRNTLLVQISTEDFLGLQLTLLYSA